MDQRRRRFAPGIDTVTRTTSPVGLAVVGLIAAGCAADVDDPADRGDVPLRALDDREQAAVLGSLDHGLDLLPRLDDGALVTDRIDAPSLMALLQDRLADDPLGARQLWLLEELTESEEGEATTDALIGGDLGTSGSPGSGSLGTDGSFGGGAGTAGGFGGGGTGGSLGAGAGTSGGFGAAPSVVAFPCRNIGVVDALATEDDFVRLAVGGLDCVRAGSRPVLRYGNTGAGPYRIVTVTLSFAEVLSIAGSGDVPESVVEAFLWETDTGAGSIRYGGPPLRATGGFGVLIGFVEAAGGGTDDFIDDGGGLLLAIVLP